MRQKKLFAIISLLVVAAQVIQVFNSVLMPVTYAQPVVAREEAWQRPEVVAAPPARLQPPSLASPQEATSAETAPFPYGNNNFGRTYKDTNNPEDHPGRHFAGPVNITNGNFYLTAGDHFFAATGISVQLARSYNSQDTTPGPMGNGWTHSYNSAVIQDDPFSQVVVRNGDGSLHVYTYDAGNGVWLPPSGIFRELVYTAGGPYQVVHKSGFVEHFGAAGRLEAMNDRNGNTLQLQYDEFGRLQFVIAPDGTRGLQFVYDDALPELVQMVIDPIGRTTQYSYDDLGNLSQVVYPDGAVAQYQYDGQNNLVRYDDPRQPRSTGQAVVQYQESDLIFSAIRVEFSVDSFFDIAYQIGTTTISDSEGISTTFEYDANSNVVRDETYFTSCDCMQGEQYLYDERDLLFTKINGNGDQTQYHSDENGNLLQVVSPIGAVTTYTYDPTFHVITSLTNAAGQSILYQHDANGNLIQETHPLGRVISYTYDDAGNLLTHTGPVGDVTAYSYDLNGNLVSALDPDGFTTEFEYDAIGRVTRKIDPADNVTQYAYDQSDRLIQVTDPISGTIDYTYDVRGNLLTLTDANGNAITHQYDGLDRLISVTGPMGSSTTYAYDSLGRPIQRTDPAGVNTLYFYDEASRLVERGDDTGRVDQYVYDPAGNMIGMSDGNYATQITYNADNMATQYLLMHPTFTAPTTVDYEYDGLSHMTAATINDGTNEWTTTYAYDALGRLVQTQDNNGRTWTTTYDAADRRTSHTLPDNSHVEYGYDLRGNMTRVSHFTPDNAEIRSYTYAYDAFSNLVDENDNGTPLTYQYDALSRMTQFAGPSGDALFTYDAVGNRLSVTGPNGSETFLYDAGNHLLQSGDTTYTYGVMGERLSQTGAAGTRNYGYDVERRLTSTTDVNECCALPFQLQLEYDSIGRFLRKTDSDGNDTFMLQGEGRLEAELDPQGNLRRVFTHDSDIVAMDTVGEVTSAPTVDFWRDGSGRVRVVTDLFGNTVAEYSGNSAEDHANFYNPIRVPGAIYLPEVNLYLMGDGQVLDPVTGLFLFRFWPWVFWPFYPYHPFIPIFRYWPWAWPWATPWGFPWPWAPWPFLWPWPGVWIRPFLIWPMWPWPAMPWLPWWYWNFWWGWHWWGHWWWWHGWWWWHHWWLWGWHFWGWWGWYWWLWDWWWPWWWWAPCWWWWGWWIWRWNWRWWWWWNWRWNWWWRWRWRWWFWWWWWWIPPIIILPNYPDYGDAPPVYPSLLADDGARHRNPNLEWLGDRVEREADAEVTDLDNFDDGVTVNFNDQTVTFRVTTSGNFARYSAAAPVHVHGWVDWNNDGDWDDAGEFVLNWSGYPGDGSWAAGSNSVAVTQPINVPNGGLPPEVWMRVRLDYGENVESVRGYANYGEVEDMRVATGVPTAVQVSNMTATQHALALLTTALSALTGVTLWLLRRRRET